MVLCHQMCVNRSERVSHTFDKIKTRLLRKSVFAFEVIEEDASYASRLVAMADKEIIVSPFFEFGIICGMVLIAYLF